MRKGWTEFFLWLAAYLIPGMFGGGLGLVLTYPDGRSLGGAMAYTLAPLILFPIGAQGYSVFAQFMSAMDWVIVLVGAVIFFASSWLYFIRRTFIELSGVAIGSVGMCFKLSVAFDAMMSV